MENVLDTIKEKLGGAKGISDALGDLKPQAVSQWKEVPVRRVLRLEELTGISRHAMRPDVFGEAPQPRKPKSRQAEAQSC